MTPKQNNVWAAVVITVMIAVTIPLLVAIIGYFITPPELNEYKIEVRYIDSRIDTLNIKSDREPEIYERWGAYTLITGSPDYKKYRGVYECNIISKHKIDS